MNRCGQDLHRQNVAKRSLIPRKLQITGRHHHLRLAGAGFVSIIHHRDPRPTTRKATRGHWERGLGGEGQIPLEGARLVVSTEGLLAVCYRQED